MLKQKIAKILAITTLITFCAQVSFALQLKNITILAEPNMVEALTKIARIYSKRNAVVVSVGFGSSGDLIRDIEYGEPADVFISAHRYWIDELKQKGLVDIYNIGHIANDSLVLVTSKDNSHIPSELLSKNLDFITSLNIVNKYRLNLIIDYDGASLGQYSKQIIRNMDLHDIKLFEKLYEDGTSINDLIANNPDSYTILLGSQIKKNSNFRILSKLKNQQIFYQALVIAGNNMDTARQFLKFLRSSEAKKIFVESGFIVE